MDGSGEATELLRGGFATRFVRLYSNDWCFLEGGWSFLCVQLWSFSLTEADTVSHGQRRSPNVLRDLQGHLPMMFLTPDIGHICK